MPCINIPIRLAVNSSYKMPVATTIAKLTKINTLPGAEVELPIGNRYSYTTPNKAGFDMSRHIIWAFQGMGKEWQIFWYDMINNLLKIVAHRWISIFVDGQGSGSVFDKER